jgi:glucose/arabinose dehydrogenase
MSTRVLGTIAAVLLVVVGYFAYQYIKNDPPDFLIKLLTARSGPPPLPQGEAAPLVVPDGFSATIFARDIKGARVMTRDQRGVMLVSQTSQGKVVALPDTNNDQQADEAVVVLQGLDRPHGLAVICDDAQICTLYVAESGAVRAYAYDAQTYRANSPRMVAELPTEGGGHYTRTLLQHPDGKRLLVSVGSSCNVCVESSPVRASVQAIDLSSGTMRTFASGLRNTVFMAIDPIDGSVWGTDNGRDLIGDDIPPDEINIIKEGGDYGWPICYGQNIHDTDFDKKQYIRDPCADKNPARIDLPAHSAALGLAFIPEEGWPDGWGNDLLVAFHGSWNRSQPTGYKVVRLDFIEDRVMQDQFTTDFVTGFMPEGGDEDDVIGRPVGILAEPGGVAYISDDFAGAIYKISLNEPAR